MAQPIFLPGSFENGHFKAKNWFDHTNIIMCIVIKIASDFHKYKMLPKKGTLYAAISLVTEL